MQEVQVYPNYLYTKELEKYYKAIELVEKCCNYIALCNIEMKELLGFENYFSQDLYHSKRTAKDMENSIKQTLLAQMISLIRMDFFKRFNQKYDLKCNFHITSHKKEVELWQNKFTPEEYNKYLEEKFTTLLKKTVKEMLALIEISPVERKRVIFFNKQEIYNILSDFNSFFGLFGRTFCSTLSFSNNTKKRYCTTELKISIDGNRVAVPEELVRQCQKTLESYVKILSIENDF